MPRKQPAPTPDGQLYFGVDARHVRQLGQELVGDRTTALTELIKNAYDADATTVTLRFNSATNKEGGVLEIQDDGSGMALKDIARGWMRISTDIKDAQEQSLLYGRARAGRKGIGRFATETLGRRLVLRTTVARSTRMLVVDFDWETGYPSGADLGDIGNPYWTERTTAADHGTLLRIEGLYDVWDDTARRRVRRAVRLLQPPFPVAKPKRRATAPVDPGFQVGVEIDNSPDTLVLEGYDDFLQAGTARVSAKMDSKGRITVHVISEHLKLDAKQKLPKRFPRTGAFSLEASYFVFRRDALGGVTLRVAQKMAGEFAGVRLYRDGLRVMPYGERDNDWLGLDQLQGSRSGTLVPIANLNWFGQISIGRSRNPDLRDTASREGLVENRAFSELRAAVGEALVWAAVQVGAARQKKVSTADKRPKASRREVLEAARASFESTVRDELPDEASGQVLDLLDAALAPVMDEAGASDRSETQRIEELLDELELLRVLASLGTSIAVFSHEVRSAVNASAAALALLPASNGKAAQQLKRAQSAAHELQDLTGYIDAYVSASQRRIREPQPLTAVIADFRGRLSDNLARNVEFETHVRPSALRTAPMARSELEAILINLLTNSVKAMDAEGHRDRRISISAFDDNEDVSLRFQDTGGGIDPKIRDRMFDPFVTDTRSPVSELGTGTGLGLKIVKDIVEDNGGSVQAIDPDGSYTTCIEVRLPRWVAQKK
jgi:signal transduction histidine kinase